MIRMWMNDPDGDGWEDQQVIIPILIQQQNTVIVLEKILIIPSTLTKKIM